MPKRGSQTLTIKEKKFVAAKVAGKTNREAYKEAGYSMNDKQLVNDVAASNVNTRPNVQAAIDAAMQKLGYTPEFAVEQLGKIAAQDEEMGAKRLAAMNILELHGWNKADRPQLHVKVEGSFFGASRQKDPIDTTDMQEGEIVDGDTNEA